MRLLKSATAAVAFALVTMAATVCAETAEITGTQLDAESFANPPREYRPIDCWWWENG
jgi:hypothetical protein